VKPKEIDEKTIIRSNKTFLEKAYHICPSTGVGRFDFINSFLAFSPAYEKCKIIHQRNDRKLIMINFNIMYEMRNQLYLKLSLVREPYSERDVHVLPYLLD